MVVTGKKKKISVRPTIRKSYHRITANQLFVKDRLIQCVNNENNFQTGLSKACLYVCTCQMLTLINMYSDEM